MVLVDTVIKELSGLWQARLDKPAPGDNNAAWGLKLHSSCMKVEGRYVGKLELRQRDDYCRALTFCQSTCLPACLSENTCHLRQLLHGYPHNHKECRSWSREDCQERKGAGAFRQVSWRQVFTDVAWNDK